MNQSKHAIIARFAEATKSMAALVGPIQKYGILHLSVIRSYDDGRFVNLSSIKGWIEDYYQKQLYLSSCFEDQPKNYFSQIFLWQNRLEGPVIDEAQARFDSAKGLTIIDRRFNYTTFYFFSSSKNNMDVENFYVNNINFLYQYIHHIEPNLNVLIGSHLLKNKKRLYEEPYICNPLPGGALISNASLAGVSLSKKTAAAIMTAKETECMSYLLRGLSIKEIAKLQCVSEKTIEKHVAALKRKFSCNTSLKLVSKFYREHHELAMALLHACLV